MSMPKNPTLSLLLLACALIGRGDFRAFAPPARASDNTELVCEAPPDDYTELGDLRLARAMSLDFRGNLPTPEELAAIDAAGDIPAALIDQWLTSDEFADRAVRYHRDLLWNNLDNQRVLNTRSLFTVSGNIYFRGGLMASLYRGGTVRCLDEPARFAADGSILTTLQNGTRLEGWVKVRPYWAPSTEIKVCAFDAQDNLVSPTGTFCGSLEGLMDSSCGCGPELRYCGTSAIELEVDRALVADLDMRLRDVFASDRSYLDLFFGTKGYVNGPLVHYYRYFLPLAVQTMTPSPVDLERLPDLTFDDADRWVEIELGSHHSGILTSTAFLLRFQTNRGRANQVLNAFFCDPFKSPSSGIPLTGAADPDLQKRHGCEYCHATLEPAASHWGRWGERGAAWLAPEDYPEFDAQCELCATTGFGCTSRCRTRYQIDLLESAYEPYLGYLKPLVFLANEHAPKLDEGPRLFIRTGLADGRFPRCVARHVAERMLGREVTEAEEPMLDDLAAVFVRSNYRYREVFRAMSAEPTYRRVR
jgi:hypothetical protein